jgi:hypothetical protein
VLDHHSGERSREMAWLFRRNFHVDPVGRTTGRISESGPAAVVDLDSMGGEGRSAYARR